MQCHFRGIFDELDQLLKQLPFRFKVWISRIKRDRKKDFKVSVYTKVCSEHFRREDFVCFDTKSRRLKAGACQSIIVGRKQIPRGRSREEKTD